MSKVIIAVVALIAIGAAVFVVTKNDKSGDNSSQSTQPASESQSDTASSESQMPKNALDPNNYTDGANIGDTLDATDKTAVTVNIDDFIFKTTYLKIKKGTKVTWVNEGQISHNVTSAASSPKKGLTSDLLSGGQSYEFSFSETGVYEYFCTPHPSQMRGVITVVD
jgi:plastocyanin